MRRNHAKSAKSWFKKIIKMQSSDEASASVSKIKEGVEANKSEIKRESNTVNKSTETDEERNFPIDKLPVEIFSMCAEYLDSHSLLALASVNTTCRRNITAAKIFTKKFVEFYSYTRSHVTTLDHPPPFPFDTLTVKIDKSKNLPYHVANVRELVKEHKYITLNFIDLPMNHSAVITTAILEARDFIKELHIDATLTLRSNESNFLGRIYTAEIFRSLQDPFQSTNKNFNFWIQVPMRITTH